MPYLLRIAGYETQLVSDLRVSSRNFSMVVVASAVFALLQVMPGMGIVE